MLRGGPWCGKGLLRASAAVCERITIRELATAAPVAPVEIRTVKALLAIL